MYNWRAVTPSILMSNKVTIFFDLLSHKEQKFHTNIKYISEKLWGDKTSSYTTFQGSKFKHYQRYSR